MHGLQKASDTGCAPFLLLGCILSYSLPASVLVPSCRCPTSDGRAKCLETCWSLPLRRRLSARLPASGNRCIKAMCTFSHGPTHQVQRQYLIALRANCGKTNDNITQWSTFDLLPSLVRCCWRRKDDLHMLMQRFSLISLEGGGFLFWMDASLIQHLIRNPVAHPSRKALLDTQPGCKLSEGFTLPGK